MSYGAPLPVTVDAVLASGYTPPSGTAADVSLSSSGLYYGAPRPTAANSVLASGYTPPSGTAADGVLVRLLGGDRSVDPSGIVAGGFGAAVVGNYTRYITATSIGPSSAVPSPTVENRWQFVTGAGGITAGVFPTTHYVADYFQDIDLAGSGQSHGGVGEPLVAYRVRTITPPFIYTNEFGTALVEEVVYTPQPWVSSAFGTAFVSLGTRILQQLAKPPSLVVGTPSIVNKNRALRVGTIDPPVFPPPLVYNQDSYLDAPVFEFNNPPNAFGRPGVANRNRFVGPAGFFRERFGNRTDTFVANKARAIMPAGIPSLTWGPETFIAHYVRYVAPPSMDPPVWLRRTIVYNDAFLVQPVSLGDTSVFGRPDPVFSNQQRMRDVGGTEHSAFGTAFIAPAIRSVSPRTIPAPFAGFPEVRFNPHPIAPASIAKPISPGPFGHAVLRTFIREARPTSANLRTTSQLGEPLVQNRNRSLRVQPIVRMEFGLHRVFNRNQYVLASGLPSLRVGQHRIADRTQRVSVGSIGAPNIPLIHRVRNNIPDPPFVQRIFVGEFSLFAMPSPEVRHPTIYPGGWDSARYGTAVVRTNSIRPLSIVDIDRFGVPWISGAQYVLPDSSAPWVGQGYVGRPTISPHTIYAPLGDTATQQAKDNHPVFGLHVIGLPGGDDRWSYGRGWPWFGRPAVSTSPRYVTPTNGNPGYPQIGTASVDLRLRRIYPTPIRGPRFGPVILGNVPQSIVFDELNPGYTAVGGVGEPTVAHPPAYPPQIEIGGMDFSAFGVHAIDLLNREIRPTGIPHRGNPQEGFTNPWGTADVGYPREYVITLGETLVWGTAVIEYLHRQVHPEGWDSLTLIDDSLDDFRYRMRVTRRNPINAATGIAASTGVGTPTVSFRVRTLTVNPIWPGYGGIPRIAMTLTPTGWDSFVAGDIDEWVAGTIKPHGDDMFRPGYPRLGRSVIPASISDGVFGGTRLARRVQVAGMPPVGFDGPSVTDEYGCSRRVITVWPIQPPTFTGPMVTT